MKGPSSAEAKRCRANQAGVVPSLLEMAQAAAKTPTPGGKAFPGMDLNTGQAASPTETPPFLVDRLQRILEQTSPLAG